MDQRSNFDYKATKEGKVRISWHGKHVATLSGVKAARFLEQAEGQDEEGLQHLMARFTGNFKRGNERSPRKR